MVVVRTYLSWFRNCDDTVIKMMIMMILKNDEDDFLRINPENWIQFGGELGIERQLQIHSRFVKKRDGAILLLLIQDL